MTIRIPGVWISQGQHVVCVHWGAVLSPGCAASPTRGVAPFRTRYTLWIWTGLRATDSGWDRHLTQRHTRQKSVWCYGPLELVRWRPAARVQIPAPFWRTQREKLLREEGVLV